MSIFGLGVIIKKLLEEGEKDLNEALNFQLAHFEGPMDLLMHLIEKNKIQIEDIPIAEITAQYFEYLENAKLMNLEIASSFLVMATQLIKIKVRLLLPRTKEAEDPRSELVDKLVEYRFFKEEAEGLGEAYEKNKCYHYREIDEALLKEAYQIKLPLPEMKVERLTELLDKALARFDEKPMLVKKEVYQIEDFVRELVEKTRLEALDFEALVKNLPSRQAVITMFLALLEALRRSYVLVGQKEAFSPIMIYSNEV